MCPCFLRALPIRRCRVKIRPISIPSGRESKLFPNRRGPSYAPNARGPKLDHTGYTHNNPQEDKIGNSSIELAEEGAQKKQGAR